MGRPGIKRSFAIAAGVLLVAIVLVYPPITAYAMQAETSRADADAVAKLVLSYLQDNPDVDPNEVSVGEPSVVVTDEVDEISIDGQVLTTRSWPVYSQGVPYP